MYVEPSIKHKRKLIFVKNFLDNIERVIGSSWLSIFLFDISFGLPNLMLCLSRVVKQASPSGFGLALTGFGLNGPGQKNPDLNGPRILQP